jgi:rSAM/selenodomain-associated transferase 2
VACYDGHVRFSVVIPAVNEAAGIRRAALSAWEAGACEVIVADGGSEDDTAAIAAACGCQVTHGPRGRASQQNAGARLATGDVLLFLHADNALAPDVGRQLASALCRPQVTCGAFRQRIEAAGWAYRWLETGNAQRALWLGMPYGDQAIFLRREVFDDLGGFKELPLLEDVLLMQRLRRRFWPVLLPGPVYVSARRWQQQGIVRQTLRNWGILARSALGTPPERLVELYRRHDQA